MDFASRFFKASRDSGLVIFLLFDKAQNAEKNKQDGNPRRNPRINLVSTNILKHFDFLKFASDIIAVLKYPGPALIWEGWPRYLRI